MPKLKTKTILRSKGLGIPIQPKMRYKLTLEGELNITPYAANQRANYYLVMHVGNLVMSGEPELEFRKEGTYWRLPAILTSPDVGHVGEIGEIIVDAQTGVVAEAESTPIKEMEKNAESLAKEKTL